MKILVLGGSDAVSRYTIDELVKNEYEVTVFDKDIKCKYINESILWKRVDVNSYAELTRALEEVRYDKVIDFTTYTKEQMRMKLSALIEKCKHYIFISTTMVYENKGKACYDEEDEKYNSKWKQGYEKSECEDVVKEYYKEYEGKYYTILRLGITWSEDCIPYTIFDSSNMPGYIIYCILANKPLPVLNNGDDKIQIIYAGDCAKNIVKLIPLVDNRNDIISITGDEFITCNHILEKLCKCLERNVLVSYVPINEVVSDMPNNENIVNGGWHNYVSNKKVKSIVKEYSSSIHWGDKINETIEYYIDNPTRARWSEKDERYCEKFIGNVNEKKYVLEKVSYSDNKNTYVEVIERGFLTEREKEKLLKNNIYLSKWLTLKRNDINIFLDMKSRGISEMVVYGYGILGMQAIEELESAGVEIKAIIDKTLRFHNKYNVNKNCGGFENTVILITVMTAYEEIYKSLTENGCTNIISLGEIIEKKYNGLNKYPEIYKYNDIEKKANLEFICLGTGSGYHDIKFDYVTDKAFNFSLPQQTLGYDYLILKNYSHKLKKGCKVLIILQYCIFLASTLKEAEEKNERYYSVLPKEQVEAVSDVSYNEYISNILTTSDKKIALLKAMSEEELERNTIDNLECWIKQLSIISFSSSKMSETARNEIKKTKKILADIIEYCKSEEFEPIIVIPPMNKTLLDKISDEFRNAYFYIPLYEVIDSKCKVMDYSKDNYYINSNMYGAPGFLVESAAKEFTKDILSSLSI